MKQTCISCNKILVEVNQAVGFLLQNRHPKVNCYENENFKKISFPNFLSKKCAFSLKKMDWNVDLKYTCDI